MKSVLGLHLDEIQVGSRFFPLFVYQPLEKKLIWTADSAVVVDLPVILFKSPQSLEIKCQQAGSCREIHEDRDSAVCFTGVGMLSCCGSAEFWERAPVCIGLGDVSACTEVGDASSCPGERECTMSPNGCWSL